MPKGYWIARVDVADPIAYERYREANAIPFAKYRGKFLVRGGDFTPVEGGSRSRNVVVEFESYEVALACWHSPEYQAAADLRRPVSTADIVVVEGYDS